MFYDINTGSFQQVSLLQCSDECSISTSTLYITEEDVSGMVNNAWDTVNTLTVSAVPAQGVHELAFPGMPLYMFMHGQMWKLLVYVFCVESLDNNSLFFLPLSLSLLSPSLPCLLFFLIVI